MQIAEHRVVSFGGILYRLILRCFNRLRRYLYRLCLFRLLCGLWCVLSGFLYDWESRLCLWYILSRSLLWDNLRYSLSLHLRYFLCPRFVKVLLHELDIAAPACRLQLAYTVVVLCFYGLINQPVNLRLDRRIAIHIGKLFEFFAVSLVNLSSVLFVVDEFVVLGEHAREEVLGFFIGRLRHLLGKLLIHIIVGVNLRFLLRLRCPGAGSRATCHATTVLQACQPFACILALIAGFADFPIRSPEVCRFFVGKLVHLLWRKATLLCFQKGILRLCRCALRVKAVLLRPIKEGGCTPAVPLEHSIAAKVHSFFFMLRYITGIKVVLMLNTPKNTCNGVVIVPCRLEHIIDSPCVFVPFTLDPRLLTIADKRIRSSYLLAAYAAFAVCRQVVVVAFVTHGKAILRRKLKELLRVCKVFVNVYLPAAFVPICALCVNALLCCACDGYLATVFIGKAIECRHDITPHACEVGHARCALPLVEKVGVKAIHAIVPICDIRSRSVALWLIALGSHTATNTANATKKGGRCKRSIQRLALVLRHVRRQEAASRFVERFFLRSLLHDFLCGFGKTFCRRIRCSSERCQACPFCKALSCLATKTREAPVENATFQSL